MAHTPNLLRCDTERPSRGAGGLQYIIGASSTALIDKTLGALHPPPFTERRLRRVSREPQW